MSNNYYLVVDPAKLRAFRGARPRRLIAERSKSKFSLQALYNWEMGISRPKPELIPALLDALGADSFSQIASPIKGA